MKTHTVREAVRELRTRDFVDLGNYRNTVLLAGVGRSGTTWVGDLINYRNHYRVMFEPFHAGRISMLSGFKPFQYLRPDNRDDAYLIPVECILSGRIRHEWVDQFNQRRVTGKRLIKDIRVNLMLKWMKTTFPEIPVVFLLRHPCAVANSRMQLGWEPYPIQYLHQDDLVADFLSPFCSLIESCTDTFEKHILAWCVQHLVPLRQFKEGEVLILFYEHLCSEPEAELRRLFGFIGEAFLPEVMEILDTPSAVSRERSAINARENRVTGWQGDVSAAQTRRAIDILGAFGLDRVYGQGAMPSIRPAAMFSR